MGNCPYRVPRLAGPSVVSPVISRAPGLVVHDGPLPSQALLMPDDQRHEVGAGWVMVRYLLVSRFKGGTPDASPEGDGDLVDPHVATPLRAGAKRRPVRALR